MCVPGHVSPAAWRRIALEQRSGPPVIFVEYADDGDARPGERFLAAGQPVDSATFAKLVEQAGLAAVVLGVVYGEI
jgi:hypothetical protein